MDFQEISTLFRQAISKPLKSKENISENDVKNVGDILEKCAKLHMKEDEIKTFSNFALFYIKFLNTYIKQFSKNSIHQYFVARMAFSVFMLIVDSTQIHQSIGGKFARMIPLIVDPPKFEKGVIREFLRIYSYMLNKIPVEMFEGLGIKESFSDLYQALKIDDIETQAITLELVINYLKKTGYTYLDCFDELLEIDFSTDQTNIYQNVRMILDNRNSGDIFSINCSWIELNSHRVIEFEGAHETDDIWLDVNLTDKKLSFFCSRNFISSIGEVKPCTLTTWEVLYFYATDVRELSCRYDSDTGILKIFLVLNTSSFNLFAGTNSSRKSDLQISLSRCSNRFYKFIELLPSLFGDLFALESLDIPEKESDLSKTLSDLVNSSNSSPIITQFEISKRISTKCDSSFISVKSDSNKQDAHSVVISDDELDETLRNDTSNSKQNDTKLSAVLDHELDETLKSAFTPKHNSTRISEAFALDVNASSSEPKHVSKPINVELDTSLQNETNVQVPSKPAHISSPVMDEKSKFNKSVSPLSFSRSVLGISNGKYDDIKKNKKLSMSIPEKQKRTVENLKIFRVEDAPKIKVSSSLMTPVIRKEPDLPEKKSPAKQRHEITILPMKEEVMDLIYGDPRFDTSILCKVQNWLKNMDDDNILPSAIEKENEIAVLEEREEDDLIDALSSMSSRNFTITTNMPPEEEMQLLMGETEKEEKGAESESPKDLCSKDGDNGGFQSSNDLLKILTDECDQNQNVEREEERSIQGKDVSDLESVSKASDDLPLTELVKKWSSTDTTKNLRNDTEVSRVGEQIESFVKNDKEKFRDNSNKESVKESEPTIINNNSKRNSSFKAMNGERESLNVSSLSDTKNDSLQRKTRKLYVPGDLSHLTGYHMEEYLQSKENINDIIVIGPKSVKSRTKQPSQVKKSSTKTENKPKQSVTKTDRKPPTKKKTYSKRGGTALTFEGGVSNFNSTDMFEKLMQQHREHKKKLAMNKILKGEPVSSSSSSMEPFGVALRNSRKRIKSSTDSNKVTKRKKNENRDIDEGNEGSKNAKINIISNVVIQPGSSTLMQQNDETHLEMFQTTSQFYLKIVKRMKCLNPWLLDIPECTEIGNILRGRADNT